MTAELVADRFEVEREVGHGAAGIVYRANDIATGRAVALKVMASTGDPSDGARLVREGQILSELDHPGIVRVVAFGHFEEPVANLFGRQYERGTPYVAMEWLDGDDLQVRQRRAPLSVRQAIEVARQVAWALAAAHDAGVVHRDIKPSNVFVREEPRAGDGTCLFAKLVDFGVATQDDVRLTQDRRGRRHARVHGPGAGPRRRRQPTRAATSTRSARRCSS
jgi:serine/threonine protein kinase